MASVEVFGTRDHAFSVFLDPADGERAQLEALRAPGGGVRASSPAADRVAGRTSTTPSPRSRPRRPRARRWSRRGERCSRRGGARRHRRLRDDGPRPRLRVPRGAADPTRRPSPSCPSSCRGATPPALAAAAAGVRGRRDGRRSGPSSSSAVDVDVVDICTPPGTHAAVADRGRRRGQGGHLREAPRDELRRRARRARRGRRGRRAQRGGVQLPPPAGAGADGRDGRGRRAGRGAPVARHVAVRRVRRPRHRLRLALRRGDGRHDDRGPGQPPGRPGHVDARPGRVGESPTRRRSSPSDATATRRGASRWTTRPRRSCTSPRARRARWRSRAPRRAGRATSSSRSTAAAATAMFSYANLNELWVREHRRRPAPLRAAPGPRRAPESPPDPGLVADRPGRRLRRDLHQPGVRPGRGVARRALDTRLRPGRARRRGVRVDGALGRRSAAGCASPRSSPPSRAAKAARSRAASRADLRAQRRVHLGGVHGAEHHARPRAHARARAAAGRRRRPRRAAGHTR